MRSRVGPLASVLSLALLGIAVSCSDGTGPRPLAQLYVLVKARGEPLPQLRFETRNDDGSRVVGRWLGETLEFDANGRVVLTSLEDELRISSDGLDTVRTIMCDDAGGTVRSQGRLVVLNFGIIVPELDTLERMGEDLVPYSHWNALSPYPPLYRFMPGLAPPAPCPSP